VLIGVAAPSVRAEPAVPTGFDALKIAAEGEAYAVRVEYDIPLPAGTGSIGYVSGEVRRSSAGGNAKGLAGAPSHMDLVVGGTVASPWDNLESTGIKQPYPLKNRLPETECFYPGPSADTKIVYPTQMRAELADVPPVSTATARCAAGPVAELHATSVAAGTPGAPTEPLGAVVETGAVAADALMRPVDGVVQADVNAHASAVSVLGGVIRIGSVVAHGASSTRGVAGSAASVAHVALDDVEVAGQRFSIADDQLELAGATVPLVSDAATSFFASLNGAIAGTGCSLGVVSTPGQYPQGYVFSRPDPKLGVDADGSHAGTMHAGLSAVCTIPDAIATKTPLSPQRAQIVFGFAYTTVEALPEPDAFGIGDLGAFVGSVIPSIPDITIPGLPDVAGISVAAPADAPAPAAVSVPAVASRPSTRVVATFHPFTRRVRALLLLSGLVALALFTHIGVTRLRAVWLRP